MFNGFAVCRTAPHPQSIHIFRQTIGGSISAPVVTLKWRTLVSRMSRLLWMLMMWSLISLESPVAGQPPELSKSRPPKAPPTVTLKRLPRAHAHNDYLHKKPLLEALELGFGSIEADVFLRDNDLLVAHTVFGLRKERTLKTLYLDPLRTWIRDNGGQIYPDGSGIWLLIDIKSDAEETYQQIHAQLEEFAEIISSVRDGELTARPVTVVISGNRPVERMRQQRFRLAGIDGRPGDLESRDPTHLIPWISTDWKSHFRWRGVGPLPEDEQRRLAEFVTRCEGQGRQLRFWGTPDQPVVWQQLWNARVSLLGTDDLLGLARFQREQTPTRP